MRKKIEELNRIADIENSLDLQSDRLSEIMGAVCKAYILRVIPLAEKTRRMMDVSSLSSGGQSPSTLTAGNPPLLQGNKTMFFSATSGFSIDNLHRLCYNPDKIWILLQRI